MSDRYTSFKSFYPFYLEEHSNRTCRALHFIGSWLVLGVIVLAIARANAMFLLLAPVVGYGFAWAGHFFFEHNTPATFQYPWYSLMGDWVMFKDILIGRITL
jgi:hypothetical protein